jgi:signal transduction histidine kinase
MFNSLKVKFIFFATLFILLSVGIPTFFLLQQLDENFNERSLRMLNATLDILNHSIDHEMKLGYKKDIQTMISEVSQNKSIDHVRIINKDGNIVFSSKQNEIGKDINLVSPHHIDFDLQRLDHRHIDLFGEKNIFSAIEPIVNKPECHSCHGHEPVIAYLDIDTDLTRAEVRFQTGSYHILFLAIAIVALLAVGLYIIFNYLISKPLNMFLYAFNDVGHGNLSTRLDIKNEGEIGSLAKDFNKMVELLNNSKEQIEELHFKQLMHADRLTTIGEMTAQLAHEINNHTGIILSRADYLQLEAAEDPYLRKIKDDLGVISNQIDKVSMVTRNILRHSKMNASEHKNIDLKDITNNAIQTLHPVLKKKGIEINPKFTSKSTLVFGDAYQLEQVLVNLINNAADAITDGGEIKVSIDKSSYSITLIVEDNGAGIPPEITDQIFHPFFTTKKDDKGTGLGLYIVKNIIKEHKGNIVCNSENGTGTKFVISLTGIDND